MARFTTADFTPFWAESIVCMLSAQDAHDIPSTGYISLTVGTSVNFHAKLRQITWEKNFPPFSYSSH
jgi:hypothetical protein